MYCPAMASLSYVGYRICQNLRVLAYLRIRNDRMIDAGFCVSNIVVY